jgi:hypothetical protein
LPKRPDETIQGGGEPGRGQRKVGMYLPATMIDHLRIVGAGLQARGFSGNLSDVLRLVLTVAKKQGLLDAEKLIRIAAEISQKSQPKPK